MTIQKQKKLRAEMSPYEKSNTLNSIWQLMNTLIPFFLLWYLAYQSLNVSYILTFVISIIAAGFLVRIFIIFHDCCHYSFFKNRRANDILGTITGIITLFSYRHWQHDHAVHHATSSNLDKRGTGDIWMMTVDEYMNARLATKIAYRLYRNPLVMFGFGPIYAFLLKNRFNRRGARLKERMNTYVSNIFIVTIITLLCMWLGWAPFLLIQGTIFMVAGSAGIWLFYIQHTFEDSYFEEDVHWEYVKAAVEGSSYYKLPKLLQWLTGNIGFHHVHHLSPRIPNYKLEDAHDHSVPLQNVPTVTLATSLQSLRFRLWDEEGKRFVSFKAIKEISSKNREKERIMSAQFKTD